MRRLCNTTVALRYDAEEVSDDRMLARDDLGFCNVMIDPEERGGLGRDLEKPPKPRAIYLELDGSRLVPRTVWR